MIPPESIRVSTTRAGAYAGEVLTIEWCVTGEPRLDPWCANQTRAHLHHRAISWRFHDDEKQREQDHWMIRPLILFDPYDPDSHLDVVHTGWSKQHGCYVADLTTNNGSGTTTTLLPVFDAATMLGCDRSKLHKGDYVPDHVCLLERTERP